MKKIISDKFWNCIKDLFSNNEGNPGRPPMNPRKALAGIAYVLENGCKWESLPWCYGKPSTVNGTLLRWSRNGTFERIMDRARSFYLSQRNMMPKWCALDASSSKAPYATWAGKNPTDRGKHGIKKNIVVDWYGAPLAVSIGPANRHDSIFFDEIIRSMNTFEKDKLGIMEVDSAYDARRCRKEALNHNFILFAATNKRRARGIQVVAPRNRWKVEDSHSWINNFRSLKTCWTKTQHAFFGLLQLGASILLFRKGIIFV